MSDAALTIWISCGSSLVSAGSLVVSVAALRRSDTLRRLARLERMVPEAVQSRARASAALDHGLGGGLQSSIPKRADNAGTEKTEFVTAREASTRLEQLVQYMRDRTERPR